MPLPLAVRLMLEAAIEPPNSPRITESRPPVFNLQLRSSLADSDGATHNGSKRAVATRDGGR
jgi:hypothetical protein